MYAMYSFSTIISLLINLSFYPIPFTKTNFSLYLMDNKEYFTEKLLYITSRPRMYDQNKDHNKIS